MHVAVVRGNRIPECSACTRRARNRSHSAVPLTESSGFRVSMGGLACGDSAIHHNDSFVSFLLRIRLAHDLEEFARPSLAPVDVLRNAGNGQRTRMLVLYPGITDFVLHAVEVPAGTQG